ncbi:hypothetical protein WR25_10235 [Diploscapter pachys]|uniref:glycerol-3-phosphate dehydrogenase (NAD(+)) n=1 Tax=Diploscapter pachys TaxID=2018661 RepID=A0A2A2KD31_9BILA|nr:hypothetical protein WR25_10235 [Diploscapter pachys]
MSPIKVTIVGSGNWGSAIARIVGQTTKAYSNEFDPTVRMWVFEEMVNGEKLSEIINTRHENVKYLPGKILPDNIGVSVQENGTGLKLISDEIREYLKCPVDVLMGANLAPEVANDMFCEATIGCQTRNVHGPMLKRLFHTDNFRISVVEDAHTVELCGALKNVVACAAGFTDGLGYGDNTKAAVIRLGLMEITKFVEHYYPGSNLSTFFESCGIADLITTCYGGRNRKVCEAFVKAGKPMAEVEKELLNGQSAQGPPTAAEVFHMLEATNLTSTFPLFVAVHRICQGEMPPSGMIDCLRDHPEHQA